MTRSFLALLLVGLVGTSCAPLQHPQNDLDRAATFFGDVGEQLSYLTVALCAYFQSNNDWPQTVEQLVAFIPKEVGCKFDPSKFKSLSFDRRGDGSLYILFVYAAPASSGASGSLSLRP